VLKARQSEVRSARELVRSGAERLEVLTYLTDREGALEAQLDQIQGGKPTK
jgi:hypothetical protein